MFNWLQYDDRFDSIAGIAIDGKPVSVGIITSNSQVLTSANPLQDYLSKGARSKITVHVINEAYNESTKHKVDCITTPFFKDRKGFWIGHGTDGKHSPLHDLVVINLESTLNVTRYNLPTERRKPFKIMMASPNTTNMNLHKGCIFAGFGYIDKQHLYESVDLEVDFIHTNVLEDCDEWIPREWGLFICISIDQEYMGLQSGSPLIHNNRLYGIGSFALKKMNRTIFVFTDVRPYFFNLGYCANDENKLWEDWTMGGYWR